MNDLEKCLKIEADVGDYKWLPEYTWAEIVGETFYQKELINLFKKYKRNYAPCEVVREPDNKMDSRAIAFFCDGKKFGHIPTGELDWWHRLFNQVGGEKTRLVGTVSFHPFEEKNLVMAKPKIQVIRKLAKEAKPQPSS